MRDALGVEHERVRLRRRGAQRLAHAALDVAGVGEEQPVVEAVDDDARRDPCAHGCTETSAQRPSRSSQPSTASCGRALRRTTSTIESATANRIALSTPAMITPPAVTAAIVDLDAVGRPQRAPRRRVDEPEAATTITAPSTAFGRSAIGPVRNSSTSVTATAATHARDLAARAHRVVDRGARAAGADRQALGDARGRVGGAHRQQLRADADVLVVAPRERARGQDLVGERHEEQARRRRARSATHVRQRRRRERRAREAGRQRADDRDAVRRRGRAPSEATIARDDDDQRRGQAARRTVAGRAAPRARRRRRRPSSPLDVAELAEHLGQLRQRLGRVDRDAEQLAELADHEHDRDAMDVADEHRAREVVGDPADPQQPRDDDSSRRPAARASRRARRRRRCPRWRSPARRRRPAPRASPPARRSAGARSRAARTRRPAAAARRGR